MKKRIANLTSNIFSPFLVALVLILLISFESTTSISQAIKWSLIVITLSILPVFLISVYLVRGGRLDSVFISVRRQRTKIYALTVILIGVGLIILLYLNAPLILVASFTAVCIMAVVFMCINLWWKVSMHAAFMTASVAVLVILYDFRAAAVSVLIPLVAWARVKLGRHSPAQVVTGGVLAVLILLAVFYFFGLV